MATSVAMHSPISDYGNFGAVASQNWNAAQERALKSDLHDAEMNLEHEKLDLDEWWKQENAKIDWDKQKIAWDQQELAEGYFDIQKERHDLDVENEMYRRKQREIKKDIARHKMGVGDQHTEMMKKYREFTEGRADSREWYDYIDFFGIGDDSYWNPEDISFEEWMKMEGRELDDYDDYQIDPDADPELYEYYKAMTGIDSSYDSSDLMSIVGF